MEELSPNLNMLRLLSYIFTQHQGMHIVATKNVKSLRVSWPQISARSILSNSLLKSSMLMLAFHGAHDNSKKHSHMRCESVP